MRRLLRKWLPVPATVLLTAALAGSPAPSSAAERGPSCDAGVGARTSIVFVHGFNADAGSWNPDTLSTLAAPVARFCTTAFNYGPVSTSWVTDPAIALALSGRILALANASQRAGGTGKVLVVAHSMGGLAIRCAASTSCGGDDVTGKVLAAVITFDTPNLGTYLKGNGLSIPEHIFADFLSADCPFNRLPVLAGVCGQVRALGTSAAGAAFTPGSAQQKALPSLPANVPVLAVAGKIKVGTSFWGRAPKILGETGDGVVLPDSAFAAARRIGSIGGEVSRDCGVVDVTVPFPQPLLTCTHTSETNNPDWTILVTEVVHTLDTAAPAPDGPLTVASVRALATAGVPVSPAEALGYQQFSFGNAASGGYGAFAFASPSGNVHCLISPVGSGQLAVACQANEHTYPDPPRPDCRDTTWLPNVVTMRHGGGADTAAVGTCTGGALVPDGAKPLPYGRSVSGSGVTCSSSERGVACASAGMAVFLAKSEVFAGTR